MSWVIGSDPFLHQTPNPNTIKRRRKKKYVFFFSSVLLGFLLAFSCEEQIYSILYPSAYGHHQCRLTAHAHTVSYTLSNEHICFRTKLREGLVGKILHHSTNYGLYNLMHSNISVHSGCGILGEQRALCTFYHCWWWIYIYIFWYIYQCVRWSFCYTTYVWRSIVLCTRDEHVNHLLDHSIRLRSILMAGHK